MAERTEPAGTKLVVGLGNPGERYRGTRHNVGWEVLLLLAEEENANWSASRFQAETARIRRPKPAILARPTTWMNDSGRAVAALVRHHELPLESLLVVVDDIELPLATIRLRPGGGSGGHNGLKSITSALGSQEYPRLRLGVERDPRVDPVDHVLSRFRAGERETIREGIERAAEAVRCWLEDGLDVAMNRYNG